MSDIIIKAAYASVVEDDEDGMLFVGFAQGEDADEPYVLFRQALGGGPVWFEATDEQLGGFDAVESLTLTGKGMTILIKPLMAHKMGWLSQINVRIFPHTESADEAIEVLKTFYGDAFIDRR